MWKAAFPGGSTSLFSFLGIGGGSGGTGTSLVMDANGGFDLGGYTGPGARHTPAGIVHKGEVVFSQDDVARFGGVGNVERIRRGYADGGAVGDITPADIMRAPSGGGSSVHVSVGVAVDDDGNLQAYVKQVSQQTTDAGIRGFVQKPEFVGHVGVAATKARQQGKLK